MTNRDFTILVLDDEADIGMMIRIMLEHKGYSVLVADRAGKALTMLDEKKVHLVIMDMLLSGVNGVDICSELKKNPTTASIPIIMISAHPNAKQICLDAGANEFIAKPFDMAELFSKIEMLLGQGERASFS